MQRKIKPRPTKAERRGKLIDISVSEEEEEAEAAAFQRVIKGFTKQQLHGAFVSLARKLVGKKNIPIYKSRIVWEALSFGRSCDTTVVEGVIREMEAIARTNGRR